MKVVASLMRDDVGGGHVTSEANEAVAVDDGGIGASRQMTRGCGVDSRCDVGCSRRLSRVRVGVVVIVCKISVSI